MRFGTSLLASGLITVLTVTAASADFKADSYSLDEAGELIKSVAGIEMSRDRLNRLADACVSKTLVQANALLGQAAEDPVDITIGGVADGVIVAGIDGLEPANCSRSNNCTIFAGDIQVIERRIDLDCSALPSGD